MRLRKTLVMLACASLLSASGAPFSKSLPELAVGKQVPEVQGPDVDGKTFKLSDYRGKVVLVDFWGDW